MHTCKASSQAKLEPKWQRGLKLALVWHFSDTAMLGGAVAVVESIRSANSLMLKHVGLRIAKRIHFQYWSGVVLAQCTWLWLWDQVGRQIHRVRVAFFLCRLLLAERYRSPKDLKDVLQGLMMRVLTWHQWSESRWLTLQGRCWQLVLGLLTSLEDLVQRELAAGERQYHLGGFVPLLRPGVRQLICVGADATRIADLWGACSNVAKLMFVRGIDGHWVH